MAEALTHDSPIHVGSHHYASCFMRDGHNVFWVGPPFNAVDALLGISRLWRRNEAWKSWAYGPTKIGPDSWAYNPITAVPYQNRPPFGSRTVGKNYLRTAIPSLAHTLKVYGYLAPDLLWVSQAYAAYGLASLVRCQRIAMRLSDPPGHFDGMPQSLASLEREIYGRAGVIFVTSSVILEHLPNYAKEHAVLLPNGVDYDHFASRDHEEPFALRNAKKPRAIYVGYIREWFDVELMEDVAKRLPNVSFTLVGPIETDVSALRRQPNVRLVGPVPYSQVPAYLRFSNVGLIPFRQTALTRATNPVKLFEYFASGLPVVATRHEEIERMGSPAILADDAEHFAAGIKKSCLDPPEKSRLEEYAKANTWAERYQLIQQNWPS